jgi:uncharacterized membrane protein
VTGPQQPGRQAGTPSTPGARLERVWNLASQYDLFVVAGLSALAASVVLLHLSNLLTVPAMAALVLALPGYAMVRALFAHDVHDAAEQTALSVGLSLCVSILGGFLLNALPDGLSEAAWTSWLTAVALIGCAIAALRRLRLGPTAAETVVAAPATADAVAAQPAPASPRSARHFQLGMLGAAAVLVFASVLLARWGVAAQPQTGFTELWLLPESGTSVSIGITNHEGAPGSYRLVLSIDGNQVREWPSVQLANGATWQQVYGLAPQSMLRHYVDAAVYRPGDTAPYRDTHLNVLPGQTAAPATPRPSQ